MRKVMWLMTITTHLFQRCICFQSKQYLRLGKVNKHDSSIEWRVGNALWKLGKGRTKAAVYVGVLEGDEIVEG